MTESNGGRRNGGGERRHADDADPTKNVLNLVDAAIERLDDLNAAYRDHYREVHAAMEKRLDIQFGHERELRLAEADRINAIRAVDVAAVQSAAGVSATQASTLAAQVATSAETLRNQVAAAATASTVALGAALDPIQKDIADLRRAQYEAQGQKTNVVEAQAGGSARGMWIGIVIAGTAVLVSLIVGVVAIATTLGGP